MRGERKNSVELNQKLNAKLLEVTELEGRLVHQHEKIADLEETLKAKGAYADELKAKSLRGRICWVKSKLTWIKRPRN